MNVNKVYLGDCLELIKDIPDKSIDLLLTDPPYILFTSIIISKYYRIITNK